MPVFNSQRVSQPLSAALVALGLLAAGLSFNAGAQQSQGPDSGQAAELRNAIVSLREEITAVQEKTLEESSDLQAQRQELVGLVQDKMSDVEPKADEKIARIQSIQQQIQGGEVAEDKQQALFAEFQQLQGELQQAQQKVLQDPEVVEEQQAFQEAMTVAMVERDPAIEDKIEQLQELAMQFRAQQQPQR